MIQYNSISLKFSNPQAKNIKSAKKNATEVTLILLSSVTGDSNNKVKFPYELLQTERQVLKFLQRFPIMHQPI